MKGLKGGSVCSGSVWEACSTVCWSETLCRVNFTNLISFGIFHQLRETWNFRKDYRPGIITKRGFNKVGMTEIKPHLSHFADGLECNKWGYAIREVYWNVDRFQRILLSWSGYGKSKLSFNLTATKKRFIALCCRQNCTTTTPICILQWRYTLHGAISIDIMQD